MSSVSYEVPHTSDIPFFSSLHGRAQREMRGIERRDLQAAVKYGRKERAASDRKTGAIRWKYTYANLVYITDGTSTREITSYAENRDIPRAMLSLEHILEHNAARERLAMNPSLCTSHTVIVVDHSASMRTCDVFDFRNRAKAVFGMLALEFVAKQRLTGEATSNDVVSLLLMHDGVDIVFEREPMGLVLYNKFAGMHDMVRPRSHGNFLPSLDQAEELLRSNSADGGCALCLLFLSDGKPSDNATGILRANHRDTAAAISNRVSLLAAAFPHRLSVATLGFASSQQDFSVLETMAEAAREAGAKGTFHRPELSASGLGSAIANSVSSLTATKTKLTTLMAPLPAAEQRHLPVLREVERERAGASHWCLAPVTSQLRDDWVPYMNNVERFEFRPESFPGRDVNPWVATGLFSNRADGIVIRRKAFAEGAERLVFGLQEYDSRTDQLVGPELVAKESKYEGRHGKTSFDHAASSLAEATKSATAFNLSVKTHLSIYTEPSEHVDQRVWEISFLRCSLYTYTNNGVKRELLAEKRLLPANRYTKWNGNNGYVFRGRGRIAPRPSSRRVTADTLKAIAEERGGTNMPDCADGYESDGAGSVGSAELDEDVDYGAGAEVYNRKRSLEETPAVFEPRPSDYLQAFSHFSYWNSGRKMLVCDLQGVMSDGLPEDESCAGVFELTDPVVHYKSQSGRKQVYGRTDLGKKGMHRFFQTHDCNAVCRLLGLPGCRSPAAAEAAEAGAGAGAGLVQPSVPPKRQRVERMVMAS